MKAWRLGYTTGTCATAAAKAAALALFDGVDVDEVELRLPNGEQVVLPIESCQVGAGHATAAVRKDAGTDPDVSHGALIRVTVEAVAGDGVAFCAGEGVGTVTRPGLAIPPGQPAINPVPRQMITRTLREVSPRGLRVTVAIPGGQALAARTFNPRLGIEGGLSILGTSGRVRPFSSPALRQSIRCALDVASASGAATLILVPGHIGARAAQRHLGGRDPSVIEVSNAWGFALDQLSQRQVQKVRICGHPGKLAKLITGHWDTHSARSPSAAPLVAKRCRSLVGVAPKSEDTVEGILKCLSATDRRRLALALADDILTAVRSRLGAGIAAEVHLIDLEGHIIGQAGART